MIWSDLTNWRIIRQKFFPRCESSELHVSLIFDIENSLQSLWLWRTVGLNGRSFTELGEIKTPLLKATHKISCTPTLRAKAVTSEKPEQDLSVGVLRVSWDGGLGWVGGWVGKQLFQAVRSPASVQLGLPPVWRWPSADITGAGMGGPSWLTTCWLIPSASFLPTR